MGEAAIQLRSRDLVPGVRFRHEGNFNDRTRYRYIQRLQYKDSEKFFTRGQVDLFRALDNDDLLQWKNRFKWGERIREVEQGPDGALWVLEDERKGSEGRLLRLTRPAP